MKAGSEKVYELYVCRHCYRIGRCLFKLFFIVCDMKHKHACTRTGTECDRESDGKVCCVQTPELEGTAEPCAVTLRVLLLLCWGLTQPEGRLEGHAG